ncbi:MAG: PDZ domain-containing protein [Planctomycetes bacterium]|nr:PDZ domain-containing protein [Planctomycetota bacterium]
MAWIIRFALGLLIVVSASPASSRAQDFLKQLEDRLKDITKPAQQEQEQDAEKPSDEELPLPNQKQDPAAQAPAPQAPQAKPRSAPIVITPRKPRKSDPSPVPSATPMSEREVVQEEGYLGLTLEPLPGGNFGLAVVEVTPQSPAWKSGFRVGDRVIGLGGEAVTSIDQFATALQNYAPGEPVKILVQRQGRSLNLTAVLQGRGVAQRVQGDVPSNFNRRPMTPYQPISGSAANNEGMTLGVSVSNLSDAFRQQFGIPVFRGAAISEVVVGSPAERAGIQPGDCIVDIDGRMILFAEDVVSAMRSAVDGQVITIGYYHGARKLQAQIPIMIEGSAATSEMNTREINQEMLTPEYVSALQEEIVRLNEELEAMRSRLLELESRLPPNRR